MDVIDYEKFIYICTFLEYYKKCDKEVPHDLKNFIKENKNLNDEFYIYNEILNK